MPGWLSAAMMPFRLQRAFGLLAAAYMLTNTALMESDMTDRMNKLQDWALEATEQLRQWFPNLDIKTPVLCDELWNAAYVLCFGADEIAKHYGAKVIISFTETEETFAPYFQVRADERPVELLDDLIAMSEHFSSDPDVTGKEILYCTYHPVPGTAYPDHKARLATLDSIKEGRDVPQLGTKESTHYLIRLMGQVRSRTVSDKEWGFFERNYGTAADAYDRPLSPFEIEEGDDLDDIDLDDVLADPKPAKPRPSREQATAKLAEVSKIIRQRTGLQAAF